MQGFFSGFSNLFLSHTNEGRKVFRAGLKSSQEKADGYEVADMVGALPTRWELIGFENPVSYHVWQQKHYLNQNSF